MKILESPLLGEFIAYLKANWSRRSGVDQRRRRLRQLVTKVRAVTDAAEGRGGAAAVRGSSLAAWLHMLRAEALRGQRVLDACCDAAAVAGSTRRFLGGLKGLVVCSADVDRLTEAVEELERLAGPGGDLDLFVKVLRLDDAQRAAASMDVDGRPEEAATGGSADSFAAAPPAPGVKRKRGGAGCSSDADNYCSTSVSQVDTIDPRKRRVVAWVQRQHWFPNLLAAPREMPPRTPQQPHSARTVALAMARVRGRIGKSTPRRRQHAIGRQLSRMSL